MEDKDEQAHKNLTELFDVDNAMEELNDMLQTEEDNPLYLTPEDVTQVIDYMEFDIDIDTTE